MLLGGLYQGRFDFSKASSQSKWLLCSRLLLLNPKIPWCCCGRYIYRWESTRTRASAVGMSTATARQVKVSESKRIQAKESSGLLVVALLRTLWPFSPLVNLQVLTRDTERRPDRTLLCTRTSKSSLRPMLKKALHLPRITKDGRSTGTRSTAATTTRT